MKFVMSLIVVSLMFVGTASVFAADAPAKKAEKAAVVDPSIVRGEITSVDATAKTITVTDKKGVDKVVTYNDKTEITKESKPFTEPLSQGLKVTVKLSDDGSVAVKIEIQTAKKHGDKKPAAAPAAK